MLRFENFEMAEAKGVSFQKRNMFVLTHMGVEPKIGGFNPPNHPF